MKENLPNEYLEFIESCRVKEYGELFTHKHHILPKFMGGDDTVNNLIAIGVEDHFKAHLILAETCENYHHRIGNKLAAAYLTNRYTDLNISKEEVSRLLREAKREYFKHNSAWNKGKFGISYHTTESLSKMSKSLKRYFESNDVWNKGKKCETLSIGLKKWHEHNENSFKGKTHSDESKEKMRKNHADFNGNKNPASKKCIDLDTGIVYGCIKEMAQSIGVPRTTMNRWVKDERKKRFNYISYE